MTVCDKESGTQAEYAIHPPYSHVEEELFSPQSNAVHEARPTKLRRVESSLLHRRLGHRSIAVLLNASEHSL
jgi:hypothetical protein